MPTLAINGLNKRYDNGTQALADVTLDITPGMFGLLGPNGAGKSTLMRTIATLQSADSGTLRFGDIDVLRQPDSLRAVLGYLPQEFGVYPSVSPLELLDHIARLKGISLAKERDAIVTAMLHRVNLHDVRNKSLGSFSGGMKQRFGIAQALLGKPQLIIVDEPTAGLDPEERARFHNLLADIGEDIVVLLSTHIVDDVRDLCQRFAVIAKGQVRQQATPSEAIALLQGRVWQRFVNKQEGKVFSTSHRLLSSQLRSGKVELRVLTEAGVNLASEGFTATDVQFEDAYFAALPTKEVLATGLAA